MTTPKEPEVEAPPATPVKDRGLWANTDFTKFWFGESISLMGVQVTAIALPLTAVVSLHASPEELGALRFAQFIPFLLFALLFGVWVDRRRKRPLMIATNVIRAVLIGLVPVLAAFDALTVPALVALSFGVGICTVLFDVCWMSYVPVLVDKQHLISANGKVTASFSAAELAGPGIGGVLVQVLSAPYALAVDAVSYAVSALTLSSIRRVEPEPEPPAVKRNLGSDVAEGLVFVLKNPYLRTIAILGSAYNFCFLFIDALFVLYAVQTLGFSASTIGLVLGLSAVGGLLGASFAQSITKRFPIGRVYVVFILVGYSGPLLIPAAASGNKLAAAAMIVAGFVLLRFGLAVANVVAVSIRQAVTPQRLMGRMTAGMRTLLFGVGALGTLTGGFLAGQIGLRPAIWVAAFGSLLATLPLFFSVIPRLRKLPASPEEAMEFAAGRGPARDEAVATDA